jgi:hypothetical protein
MKRSSGPRKTVNLSESVHQQLNMYAIAAGAAGVSVLALAQPVEAKIVYTPKNVAVNDGSLPLDLDNNGIVDFYLVRRGPYRVSRSASESAFSVCHVPGTQFGSCHTSNSASNALNAVIINAGGSAAALKRGALIGPGHRFRNKQPAFMGGRKFSFTSRSNITNSYWYGPWLNSGRGVKNRYLGLKFKINGNFHFGWARLTVTTIAKQAFRATLTGYAYETVPNKGIIAGQTRGPDQIVDQTSPVTFTAPPPTHATLGLLALGTPGLSIWRRKESVGATQ